MQCDYARGADKRCIVAAVHGFGRDGSRQASPRTPQSAPTLTKPPFKTPQIVRALNPKRDDGGELRGRVPVPGRRRRGLRALPPPPPGHGGRRPRRLRRRRDRPQPLLHRPPPGRALARLGLGLRRGDAVLVLAPDNSLLIPPILLGVLAAAGVVVTADPEATAGELAAVAHGSGAVIIVAAPEVAQKVAGCGVPLLLTSLSTDPRALSAEELMDGGDPTALAAPEIAADRPCPTDVALVVYSSAGEAVAMSHADLVATAAGASSPDEGRRVCLVSLPICGAGVHGLPLLALGLPAAGVTTVLASLPSDPTAAREAVAAHGATDLVMRPEEIVALAAPMAQQGKLSGLRRVMVVQAPLAAEARQALRRRLPWVELAETFGMLKGTEPASDLMQVASVLTPSAAASTAAIPQNGEKADEMSVTKQAITLVPPTKKIQQTVLGDIFTRSITGKILRKHATCNQQSVSKV